MKELNPSAETAKIVRLALGLHEDSCHVENCVVCFAIQHDAELWALQSLHIRTHEYHETATFAFGKLAEELGPMNKHCEHEYAMLFEYRSYKCEACSTVTFFEDRTYVKNAYCPCGTLIKSRVVDIAYEIEMRMKPKADTPMSEHGRNLIQSFAEKIYKEFPIERHECEWYAEWACKMLPCASYANALACVIQDEDRPHKVFMIGCIYQFVCDMPVSDVWDEHKSMYYGPE